MASDPIEIRLYEEGGHYGDVDECVCDRDPSESASLQRGHAPPHSSLSDAYRHWKRGQYPNARSPEHQSGQRSLHPQPIRDPTEPNERRLKQSAKYELFGRG